MNADRSLEFPAILGGLPVCPDGLPTWPIIDDAMRNAFLTLAERGDWGRYHADGTRQLQEELCARYQLEHALLTCSGTAAIELALRGVKVGAGDEVILAAYDFKANFVNIAQLGALPVLVDIRDSDGQLDVEQLRAAITSKTKAILISHLHGGLVESSRVYDIASSHGVAVIEDCCQISCCAEAESATVGSRADVCVSSFGGSKLLTSGRGGAVLTNRDDISQRIRIETERGNSAYPLSEMQAAILLPQLETLQGRHQVRERCVAAIRRNSSNTDGLVPFAIREGAKTDYYKLGFWYVSSSFEGLSRERFCEAMRAEGIPIDPGFSALHQIHARRRYRSQGTLEIATRAHSEVVVLHHPFLLGDILAAGQFQTALDKLRHHARILSQQT